MYRALFEFLPIGGLQAITVLTPATLAVAMVMILDEMWEYRPPGT